MATSGINPSFQDFTQLARLRESSGKEVTLSSSGETLKTRGNFMSRLVEIFRPEKAQAQHRAAAEAFIGAVEKELTKPHAAGSPFHHIELISEGNRQQILGSLRQQLSDQLEGQARLTGADIKSVLEWLNTEAPYQYHTDTLEVAESVLGDLEISAEDDKVDFSVRWVIDRFDDATPLDAEDMDVLQRFDTAYKATRKALDELFNPDTGTYAELSEAMADKKRAATGEGRMEDAQTWDTIIQWTNDKNREVNDRVKGLSGVAAKVTNILNHIQQRADAPQKTHGALEQPAVTGSAGRSILKTREAGPVDPNAVLVDDGTNDEVHTGRRSHRNADGSRAQESLARSRADLADVGPRERAFTVSFAAGREVKTLDQIDQRLQAGLAEGETPDPATPAATPALRPQPSDFV